MGESVSEDAQSPEGDAAPRESAPRIEERRMRDGSRLLFIDGQPYAESDPQRARLEGAADALRDEAAGWGVSMLWIYVGLPVLAFLLYVVAQLVSCGNLGG